MTRFSARCIALLVVIGSLLTSLLHAQVAETVWVRRYNGPGDGVDIATALAIDGWGNVYLTGYSEGAGTSQDFATVKYSGAGVQQWVTRYNGPDNKDDLAWDIAVDAFSLNVFVAGSSWRGDDDCDYAAIRYNSAGVQQWAARYVGSGDNYNEASALAQWGGGVIVAGTGDSWPHGQGFVTVSYDYSGGRNWVRRYQPGVGYSAANAVAMDTWDLPGIYVTGPSVDASGYTDYATVKYDVDGAQQWVVRYSRPGSTYEYEASRAIAVNGYRSVAVTGESEGVGTGADFATVKYSGGTGAQIWVARYDGPASGDDVAYAVAEDDAGNVYVTGSSAGTGSGLDYATVKYNSSGTQQWVARYNGPGNGDDCATQVAIDGSGNVYVSGYSDGAGTGQDCATVKYSAAGAQQWVARYNGPGNGNDAALGIAVDDSGAVYVAGRSDGVGTSSDYVAIKYIEVVVGVKESDSVPTSLVLAGGSPNPFRSRTCISYALPRNGDVRLGVFDASGTLVRTLAEGPEARGFHGVTWDGRDQAGRLVPSGLYFYRLEVGDFAAVRKAVKAY